MLGLTQEDIVSNWSSHGDCAVSVVCTSYNQERYISDALESFLSQTTRFPFEVIVHDDASSDSTQSIIRAYAARYPGIIRPVLQRQNQYSQGGFKPLVYASSHAKGKYLALCEGDDYWCSSDKLQQQFDAMEEHPELDFCFHPAFHEVDGRLTASAEWDYGHKQVLPVERILRRADGTFAPTCSYMLRAEVLGSLPDWFFNIAPVGDFFIEMYSARRGGALFLPEPMGVYRRAAFGSWHVRTYNDDEVFGKYLDAMLISLDFMQDEFESHEADINWKKAWLLTFAANHYLYSHDYRRFRASIDRSVEFFRYVSRKQQVLYSTRLIPRASRCLVQAHNLLFR